MKNLSFSIDSRTITPDQIFVALAGAKVDGHTFVPEVLARGCAGVMIAQDKQEILRAVDPKLLENKHILIVPDPHSTLVQRAAEWRAQFAKPVIAITGSIGKTSTTQLLGRILRHHGANYLLHQGKENSVTGWSSNTDVGLALQILQLSPEHDGALIEIGISKRGEMERIVSMARPTHALITTIGHSHLSGLGPMAEVAAEKREIFHYLKEDQLGFINGDVPLLSAVSYRHPVVRFGYKTANQIQARKIRVEDSSLSFTLKIYGEKYSVTLPHTHTGMITNVLAATAIAHSLGVPVPTIIEVIQQSYTVPGRFETRLLKNGGTIIHDSYNASPESMKAALAAFHKISSPHKKIAVLGDMLELGPSSVFWHRQIGRYLRKTPSVTHVILVGSHTPSMINTIPANMSVTHAPSWREALAHLQQHLASPAHVLVKGSRGMALENLVESVGSASNHA